jgi:transcription elongation factor Elf1
MKKLNKENDMATFKTPKCPVCASAECVVMINTGEKVGTAIGLSAGEAGEYSETFTGASMGAANVSFVPVIGTALSAVVVGIIGALARGAAGGTAGKIVGHQVDRSRKTFRCNKCGRVISG